MPGHPHNLSPEGWPLTREGWLEDGYRIADPVDNIPVAPVVAETMGNDMRAGSDSHPLPRGN